MGLDMYLTRRRSEDVYDEHTEVMYWRKANAIHLWFVQNCQGGNDNCEEYEVTLQQLHELLKRCTQVVNLPDTASSTLRTQSGFFFGSTEYDEWYYDGLKETAEALTRIINEHREGDKYIYQSSW